MAEARRQRLIWEKRKRKRKRKRHARGALSFSKKPATPQVKTRSFSFGPLPLSAHQLHALPPSSPDRHHRAPSSTRVSSLCPSSSSSSSSPPPALITDHHHRHTDVNTMSVNTMSVMRMTIYVLVAALTVMLSSESAQAIPASASSMSSSANTSSSSSPSDKDITIPASSLANATSHVVSVWRDDDDCSATTQRSGCLFDAICDVCLSRSGCAIESTTGKCISISRIDPANTGVEYFWNGKAEYCDTTDAACTTCASGTSDAPCYGDSGCFCLRQCELQSRTPLECGASMSFSKISYLLLVVIVFGSLSLYIHIRRVRINNAVASTFGLRRLVQRRPRPRDQEANPMALKLDNWKKHRVDHSEEFVDLELKSCFVQIDDEDNDSQRETITHDTSSESLCSELEGFEYGREHEDSGACRPSTTGSEATITAHVRRDGAV